VEDHHGFIIGVAVVDHVGDGTAGRFRSWRRDHQYHHRCRLPRLPCFNRDRNSMVTRIVNSLYLLFKINNYILINILSY
jgi:hypothetical protein